MTTDTDEIEKNKQLARMQREIAISTKKIAMDEMSHASRWIMASVLAVNSGGLIACLSKLDGLSVAKIAAVSAFYFGLTLAVVAGWSLIRTNQKSLPFHSRMIAVWEMGAIDGNIDHEEIGQAARQFFEFAKKESGLADKLNKLSFVAFSVGLVLFGVSATTTGQTTEIVQSSVTR